MGEGLSINPENRPEKAKTPEILEGGKRYVYRDNSTSGRQIVFECTAKNILEADLAYEKATGFDPKKQNQVGCEIFKA